MNKKIYFGAILLAAMTACSGALTSCVDTDEPAGIEQLRGAKAHYLEALAALKNAEAEVKKAEVATQNAITAQEEATAKKMQAEAAKAQAEAEAAQAATAEAKAKAEAAIAKAQQDMEEAAEAHKAAMIAAQTETAKAQQAYENALKAIELQKLVTSPEELEVLGAAEENLVAATKGVKYYAEQLELAQKAYYKFVYSKEDGLEVLNTKIADLKDAIVAAQLDSLAAVAEIEALEEALANGYDANKYDEQYNELVKQIDSLKFANVDLDKKLADIKASAPYEAIECDSIPAVKEQIDGLIDANTKIEAKKTVAKTKAAFQVTFSDPWKDQYDRNSNKVKDLKAIPKDTEINDDAVARLNKQLNKLNDLNDFFFSTEALAVYEEFTNTSVEDAKKNADEAIAEWEKFVKIYKAYDAEALQKASAKMTDPDGTFDKLYTEVGKQNSIYDSSTSTLEQKADALVARRDAEKKIVAAVREFIELNQTKGYVEYVLNSDDEPVKLEITETIDGEPVKTSKTLEEWLAEDNAVKFYEKVAPTYGIDVKDLIDDVPGLIDYATESDVENALQDVSYDAFGRYFLDINVDLLPTQNWYMRVIPSDEEMDKVAPADRADTGKYGTWYYAVKAAETDFLGNYKKYQAELEANIAKVEAEIKNYDDIKAEVATANAELDAQIKANSETIKALGEKKKAFQAQLDEMVKEVEDEQKANNHLKDHLTGVKDAIVKAWKDYFPTLAADKLTPAEREKAFKEAMKTKIEEALGALDKAEKAIAENQKKLADAEKLLARAEENGYGKVGAEILDWLDTEETKALEVAKQNYEIAVADYDKALAEVKALMDALSK